MDNRKKSRITLVLILLLFVGPFLAALWLYHHRQAVVLTTTNHGELLSPPIVASAATFERPDHQLLPLSTFAGHWLMLYFTPNNCHATCQKTVYDMRQIRLALGKNQQRVQRMVVMRQADIVRLDTFVRRYPDVAWGLMRKQQATTVFTQALGANTEQGHLFLLDPHGNMLMHYTDGTPAKNVLKDLQRLLRVSHIG